jgi:hypothetical protein
MARYSHYCRTCDRQWVHNNCPEMDKHSEAGCPNHRDVPDINGSTRVSYDKIFNWKYVSDDDLTQFVLDCKENHNNVRK